MLLNDDLTLCLQPEAAMTQQKLDQQITPSWFPLAQPVAFEFANGERAISRKCLVISVDVGKLLHARKAVEDATTMERYERAPLIQLQAFYALEELGVDFLVGEDFFHGLGFDPNEIGLTQIAEAVFNRKLEVEHITPWDDPIDEAINAIVISASEQGTLLADLLERTDAAYHKQLKENCLLFGPLPWEPYPFAIPNQIFDDDPKFWHRKNPVRNLSPTDKEIVRENLKEMLQANIVAEVTGLGETQSLCVSPVIVARNGANSISTKDKKREEVRGRVCNDYSLLGNYTRPIPYPSVNQNAELEKLAGFQLFFQFDFRSGYHQIGLPEADRPRFDFIVDGKIFRPKRQLFGMSNAGAICNWCWAKVLQPSDGWLARVMDDFAFGANSHEEGQKKLQVILEQLKKFSMRLKPEKCKLGVKSIVFCGVLVDSGGIHFQSKAHDALLTLKSLDNGAELISFLHSMAWYQPSLPEYFTLTQPLFALREEILSVSGSAKKIKNRERLSPQQAERARTSLIAIQLALREQVVLHLPNPELSTVAGVDASNYGSGGVLYQCEPGELALPPHQRVKKHLWCYAVRHSPAQMKYCTRDKEFLSLLRALEILHRNGWTWLRVIFETDHANVRNMFQHSNLHSNDHHYSERVTRGIAFVRTFNVTIRYIQGKHNLLPDYLSRMMGSDSTVEMMEEEDEKWTRTDTSDEIYEETASMEEVEVVESINAVSLSETRRWSKEWPTVAAIKKGYESANDIPAEARMNKAGLYELENSIWIPNVDSLPERIICAQHCSGLIHPGIETTYTILRARVRFTKMKEKVTSFINGCIDCIQNHALLPVVQGSVFGDVTQPGMSLSIDYEHMPLGRANERAILTIRDNATGLVSLAATQDETAKTAATALLNWIKMEGLRAGCQIQSDRGSHFVNDLIGAFTEYFQINHQLTAAYAQWGNPAETAHRLNNHKMRAILSERKLPLSEWPQLLPLVNHAINASPSKLRGNLAPLELARGYTSDYVVGSLLMNSERKPFWGTPVTEKELQDLVNEHTKALEARLLEIRTLHEATLGKKRAKHNSKAKVLRNAYHEGSFVMLSSARSTSFLNKLEPRWTGPFQVVKTIVPDFVYDLEHIATKARVFGAHIRHLHPVNDPMLGQTIDPEIIAIAKYYDSASANGIERIEELVLWKGALTCRCSKMDLSEVVFTIPQLHKLIPTALSGFLDAHPDRELAAKARLEIEML